MGIIAQNNLTSNLSDLTSDIENICEEVTKADDPIQNNTLKLGITKRTKPLIKAISIKKPGDDITNI